jgi:hypothetical protein
MKPKRTATVSKKITDNTLKNSTRWNWLLENYSKKWEELSEEGKEFFEALETGMFELINEAADQALAAGEKA